MTPFLTVCIPAYQAARHLPAALASLRAQTFGDWELIVTEDGSAEPVEGAVLAFAASVAQPVTYQTHPKNLGLPATRNTAIAAARGAWAVLLDADDVWLPSHLADLVLCARRHPAAELVHSGCTLFDDATGLDLGVRAPSSGAVLEFPRSLYLGDYIVQPSSAMLRTSLWSRVGGFDPAYRHVEDREMWLRCARADATFAYTGRETCRYRKHSAALTAQHGAMALASARVLQQHLDWDLLPLARRESLTAEAWLSAGRLCLRALPGLARDCFTRAWRIRRTARTAAYWLAAALLALNPARHFSS